MPYVGPLAHKSMSMRLLGNNTNDNAVKGSVCLKGKSKCCTTTSTVSMCAVRRPHAKAGQKPVSVLIQRRGHLSPGP